MVTATVEPVEAMQGLCGASGTTDAHGSIQPYNCILKHVCSPSRVFPFLASFDFAMKSFPVIGSFSSEVGKDGRAQSIDEWKLCCKPTECGARAAARGSASTNS